MFGGAVLVVVMSLITSCATVRAPSAWTLVRSPNPVSGFNELYGVSCADATDCWAVGSRPADGGGEQPLIERFDGNDWTIVGSPSPGNGSSLRGITCVNADDCWAVGYYCCGPDIVSETLVEHYSGGTWGIVPSPNGDPRRPSTLFGVTCVTADDCWAVGGPTFEGENGRENQTVIEHYTGRRWELVTSPDPVSGPSPQQSTNDLFAVACVDAQDCWAVGRTGDASTPDWLFIRFKTLVLHFTGADWTVVTSPDASDLQPNDLFSVSCAGPSDCWAVGGPGDGGAPQGQILLEHFSGKVWSLVQSPDVGGEYQALQGVSCTPGSGCWAVGISSDGTTPGQTLIEHLTGNRATVLDSPNADGGNSILEDVTCWGPGICWSVGWSANASGSASATLIEHQPAAART